MAAAEAARRTFLFTDVEGSTRLWESHPAAMSQAVAEHDRMLRSVMEAHGGDVFKTLGDAFCVAFSSGPRALAAAIEAQVGLQARAWGETGPLRVRMCLHAGPVEARDRDFFGTTVNRTARILALGHGGQILVSTAGERELGGALPARARLLDLGAHKLRDLSEPERVYQVLHPDLQAQFGQLRSLDTLPNNLPLMLTSFVGRDEDLLDVSKLLPRSRLLTLVGAGGCGKTRLAVQVGAEALGRFRDGVWLVEFASLPEAALLSRAVAATLAVRPESGRPLLDTLCDHLRGKQLLLLLDNCEHVIDAAARLAHDLLTRCSELHVMATSREPLRITGETVWPVAPLTFPANGVSTLRELGGYSAPRLFLDRARAAAPRTVIADADASLIGRICRRLDGIPLAIELAAARIRTLSLHDLHRGLDDRFRVLSRGDRTALPRHQTLRSTIDWSYGLLAPEERSLLNRLSVFAGGWTEQTARELHGADIGAPLAQLLDQSLAVVGEGARRYALLESVRAYAAEKLEPSGEADDYRRRHALLFAGLVRRSVRERNGRDSGACLARVEEELDNVRAALDWMLKVDGLREAGLEMAANLWNFAWVRGYIPEVRRSLARFLEGAEEYASPETQAQAHYAAGVLAKEMGDYAAARDHYRRNLELRDELDDEPGGARATTLFALGHVVRIEGDYANARRLYEESLAISERHGEMSTMGGTLDGLGNVCSLEGDYQAALDYHAKSLDLFRKAGDRIGQLIALCGVGDALYRLGRAREARSALRKSLHLARQLHDRQGMASALRLLGEGATQEGRLRRAGVLLSAGLGNAHEIGSRPEVVRALESLAELSKASGRMDGAARLFGAVHALSEHMGIPTGETSSGGVEYDAGRAMSLDEAVQYALDTRA